MGDSEKRLLWTVAASLAVLVLFAAIDWWRGPQPPDETVEAGTPPDGPAIPTPESLRAQQYEQRRQAAAECAARAAPLAEQAAADARDPQRLELERRWIDYLQRIQTEQDYRNWPDAPCDLYLRRGRSPLQRAIASGTVLMHVRGKDLQAMTVTLTSYAPDQAVVLPVGTLFVSAAAGTQNMVAATSVRFAFGYDSASRAQPAPGLRRVALRLDREPRTVTQEVPAYCVNRWRAIPDEQSTFSTAFPDGTQAVDQLVACLDRQSASHRAKQVAVWLISDELLSLSPQEYVARAQDEAAKDLAEAEAKYGTLGTVDAARVIGLVDDDTPPEDLEQLAQMSRDDLLRAVGVLQVLEYRESGAPLLRACGHDLSNARLFALPP